MSDIQTMRQWTIEAEIMPKAGVNDPQGEAVHSGLQALGFDVADRVRVGKRIEIRVQATSHDEAVAYGTEMCDKLLANPVIEAFTVAAREV